MNLRNLFLTGIACVAFVAFASTERAAAQCCTYDVTATTALNGCFPITILTDWGTTQETYTKTSGQPGHVTRNISNCPPTKTFNWVSIDGGTTQIPLNTATNITLPCGCVTVIATLDTNGCVSISIFPCV